jgi:hypothetical protein
MSSLVKSGIDEPGLHVCEYGLRGPNLSMLCPIILLQAKLKLVRQSLKVQVYLKMILLNFNEIFKTHNRSMFQLKGFLVASAFTFLFLVLSK